MIYEGIDTRTAKKSAYVQLRLEPMRKYQWKRYARESGLPLTDLIVVGVEKFIHDKQE